MTDGIRSGREGRRSLRIARSLALPLTIVAIHFGIFSLARLGLLLSHTGDFAGLSCAEIGWAFVRGLQFDASIIFLVIGIPVFMLMLPVGSRRWQTGWGWACFATLLLFALVLAGDEVYFGFVGRHVGGEITAPEESFEAALRTGWIAYRLPMLAFVCATAVASMAWQRLLRAWEAPSDRGSRVALSVGCLPLMYMASVGTLSGGHLKIVHAFDGVRHEATALLMLNGPFSILHSLDFLSAARVEIYPWDQALQTARESLFAPDERAVDDEYPLLRARPARPGPKPNIVLIMLESWDASVVDAHRREQGLAPLGLTSNYDALSRQGVLLSRFYAAGQRSMDGMSALIAGFPTLPRAPYLGRGVEQSALPFLGRLALREGYETYFIQSAHHRSFRNDAIASLAGFSSYEGGEDIPPIQPAVSRAILGGEAWDHEMFAEANRRLSAARKPFLAFLYTATTHTPYAWPAPEWERYPADSDQGRYRNSIAYADWALGQFFEGARRAGYFDSTIFIITADHVGGPGDRSREDPATYHHIPGLILAPGLEPRVDARVAGQLDVIPTIADLAGWSSPQAALGRSIFAPGGRSGALCVEGELLLRFEDDAFIVHDLERRIRSGPATHAADLDAMERRLLSIYQVGASLVRRNRLYPPDRELAGLAPAFEPMLGHNLRMSDDGDRERDGRSRDGQSSGFWHLRDGMGDRNAQMRTP